VNRFREAYQFCIDTRRLRPEGVTEKVAREMMCLNASLRAQRSNPSLRAGLNGLLRRKGSSQ
jgi:hypothetical protein